MYQWAPPGGSDSGARGVSPMSRCSGSSASRSGTRSNSSVPRPCSRTRAPSGSPAAERNWCGHDSRPRLTPGTWLAWASGLGLAAEAGRLRCPALVGPEPVVGPASVPADVGRLVVEREVVGNRVARGVGAAERLAGDDHDSARERCRGIARLVAADRVVPHHRLLRADETDPGAGDGWAALLGLTELVVRPGRVALDKPPSCVAGRAGVQDADPETVVDDRVVEGAAMCRVAQEEAEGSVPP